MPVEGTMHALITTEPDNGAEIQDVPIPKPKDGEILVKIACAAQNPTDWKGVSRSPPGRRVGADFSGTVADPNGSSWKEGTRVAGFVQGVTPELRGTYAEYVVIESSLVFPIPEKMSFQEAAVVPLPFGTAVQAIFQRLEVPEPTGSAKSKEVLIVSGGASSVGKYAIQLGALAGMTVVATASKKNHDYLKSLGADIVVDYNVKDWEAQVRELTQDNATLAFDCIAENGTVQSLAKCLSPSKGGKIVGTLPTKAYDDEIKQINPKVTAESTLVYTVFGKGLKYGFENCSQEQATVDRAYWEKWLGMLPDLLASGKIKPNRIREMGGLEDVLTGFKHQAEGKVSAEKLVYDIAVGSGSKI